MMPLPLRGSILGECGRGAVKFARQSSITELSFRGGCIEARRLKEAHLKIIWAV